MTKTVVIPPGNTESTETVTLLNGETAKIGIYAETEVALRTGVQFKVYLRTPGAANFIGRLNTSERAMLVDGPGVYEVRRPAYEGIAFGAYSEV